MSTENQELIETDQNSNLPALPEKQTEALMQMIQGAVMHPEIDPGVIERLWEMQKESQDRDAKAAYAKAKARAQKKMPTSISGNAYNEQTKSTYSNLTAVNTKVVPIYSAAGFSISFNTAPSEQDNHVKILGELLHEQGHSEMYEFDLPFDLAGIAGTVNKTPIHAKASTIKYGQRYLVCMIWNIATGDDNDGNDSQPPKKDEVWEDENFDNNFPKWKELIEKGERTVGDIMNMIATKGKLTDDQKTKLRAIKPRN